MPLSTILTDSLTRNLPPVISPRYRATLDYAIAGSLIGAVPLFSRRNPRAALGCLLCGGAEILLTRLTDYSGRGNRPVSMHTRRQMDLGLAALLAVLPEIMEFRDPQAGSFFFTEAAILTAVSNLTKPTRVRGSYARRAA